SPRCRRAPVPRGGPATRPRSAPWPVWSSRGWVCGCRPGTLPDPARAPGSC
ncbi:MAG: hypothetical protein AVDCRST_MAG57-1383, partial [uncultured Blastococcus sp.]